MPTLKDELVRVGLSSPKKEGNPTFAAIAVADMKDNVKQLTNNIKRHLITRPNIRRAKSGRCITMITKNDTEKTLTFLVLKALYVKDKSSLKAIEGFIQNETGKKLTRGSVSSILSRLKQYIPDIIKAEGKPFNFYLTNKNQSLSEIHKKFSNIFAQEKRKRKIQNQTVQQTPKLDTQKPTVEIEEITQEVLKRLSHILVSGRIEIVFKFEK